MRTREALRREKVETSLTVLAELFVSGKKIEGRAKKTTVWYFSRVFRAKQLPTLSCKCQSSLNYGIICD